jgi:hypothetical protein
VENKPVELCGAEHLVYGVGQRCWKHLVLSKSFRSYCCADNSGTDAADAVEVFTPTEQPSVYELTKEEGMRLAKEYSRFLVKEARLKAAAENVRLQLKKDAIAALPPHLREKALVPDLTPFPPTRIPASLTPSIPGYVEEMTRSAEASAKIQRMR